MKYTEEKLIETVKELLKSINENVTGLWQPDLEDTVECIILYETEYNNGDFDEDNEDVKFSGVNDLLMKLEELIKDK